MVPKSYRLLALVSCIGMLLVLLNGALVTNTGSGRGCGDDWPLCHGKFIPAYTLESFIEYSHRLVTGMVGIVVVLVFIYTLLKFRSHKEAVLYSGSALFFTVLQALLGAAAVMWPQTPPVMALHFGFSLMAFASTMLLVIWISRFRKGKTEAQWNTVPASVYKLSFALFVYTYIVVYMGAYIRHTKSGGGCLGWPLCNGEVIPELSGASGIVFLHRIAALILVLFVILLTIHIHKRTAHEGLLKVSRWAVFLVVVQVFSGALLTYSIGDENVFIFTGLLHNLIICGYFALLIDICIQAWRSKVGHARS
ncbi:heme A synthase [Paenibacillus sp. MAHUQ-46]|uniref:Heme A synthase n=1 Tax=Paenibacillus roseus TaxID=2798579 RepID=A0A934MPP4_9BACL|nr:COX15/CtaA family protein [Paenibacillus roseus]MBJ6362291.1 heme A synthase [Paenibacillus roseus]